jgi:hypothetical protein
MPPDFLNSREDAVLLWAIIILGYLIHEDPTGIGGGFIGVFRGLNAKLRLLYGTAALYSALSVYGARELGLWHSNVLKTTV